jgi:hypothetical protein
MRSRDGSLDLCFLEAATAFGEREGGNESSFIALNAGLFVNTLMKPRERKQAKLPGLLLLKK